MMKTFLFSALLALSFNAAAADNYQFNQNYNFNKYISAGEWTFHPRGGGSEIKGELKKEKAGYTDMEGNEVYHYHFTGKDIDFYLVPDNPFYPLWYRYMHKNAALNREYTSGYRGDIDDRDGFIVLNDNQIACIRIKTNAVSLDDEQAKYTRIGMTSVVWDNMRQRVYDMRDQVATASLVKGKGKGSPYGTWVEFMKAHGLKDFYAAGKSAMNQYPGIPKYYEMVKKYYDKLLEEAKTKKYKELMNAFKDGDYVLHCDGGYHTYREFNGLLDGYVRIKIERNGTEIKSLTIQNCFDDGKFYDKEKFFVKLTLDGSGNAVMNGSRYKLVPFDGRILVCDASGGGEFGTIGCVITPHSAEYFSDFVANEKLPLPTDEMYYCTTELESAYDQKKDPYLFYNFYQRYMATLFGNHK